MELNSRLIQFLSVASHTDRIGKAIYWVAGLVQLLFILSCSLIGDYAPIIAKYAGRYCGKLYRFYTDRRTQSILSAIDYYSRQFVTAQLGTQYPSISYQFTPAICLPTESVIVPPDYVSMTRRQLLQYAKQLQIVNYSRMDTDSLRQALLLTV